LQSTPSPFEFFLAHPDGRVAAISKRATVFAFDVILGLWSPDFIDTNSQWIDNSDAGVRPLSTAAYDQSGSLWFLRRNKPPDPEGISGPSQIRRLGRWDGEVPTNFDELGIIGLSTAFTFDLLQGPGGSVVAAGFPTSVSVAMDGTVPVPGGRVVTLRQDEIAEYAVPEGCGKVLRFHEAGGRHLYWRSASWALRSSLSDPVTWERLPASFLDAIDVCTTGNGTVLRTVEDVDGVKLQQWDTTLNDWSDLDLPFDAGPYGRLELRCNDAGPIQAWILARTGIPDEPETETFAVAWTGSEFATLTLPGWTTTPTSQRSWTADSLVVETDSETVALVSATCTAG
jgi:hypothetical protein